MAEHPPQTQLAATCETREHPTPDQNSIYAAFVRVREITFGKNISEHQRNKKGLPLLTAFDQEWAQQTREAAEESNRQAKASWLNQVARDAATKTKAPSQMALLRNLNDKELAHHLSQQHGDPALLEVASRLQRLIDQLDDVRSSQYQCIECGAHIRGPL